MTAPIEVSIRVDDRDGQPAASLYRWLALDPQVRQDATVSIPPTLPGAGEMSGALEVINVVLSNSIAIGGLLVAVSSWRKSRPRPPTIRFERDGVSVIVEDASPETMREVLDALADRPPDPGEDPGDGAI